MAKTSLDSLKHRVLFVITAIIIFRIGSYIPIPGINTTVLSKLLNQQNGTIIDMLNMFSGGALSRASIFALGIMPYISASVIIQLLSIVNPTLADIKKDGEIGRLKINQYTRYSALALAILQSVGITTALPKIAGIDNLIFNHNMQFYFISVMSLVTGTIFLMWLGEQLTDHGIGNGISILIFTGIIASLPPAIGHTLERSRQGDLQFTELLLIVILIFAIIFFVVFVERGQRRIIVHYAHRQQGRRPYYQPTSHLPLKINMAGVIPAIFASSIILFPATIASWFGRSMNNYLLTQISLYLQPGQLIYLLLYSTAIVFFCFFYTVLVFNPRDTADNLKKSGAFIPGIRPGEKTARYIDTIMTRLTMIGAIYITFICLVPEIMRHAMKVPFYFGGTSLLIVVVVIIDFISQIQTLIMSSKYESALKKANLKGFIH
ncbi:preprotein translocase subunit SecY [Candidatus Ishikawella capsulata]|uniref:Protein translocase subunit SecY n=1 Tax=Candidatus Ishikawaella capsulata Mpkobe TaxID=476281 RepID=C5WCS5_9ENTR|nr:preprotein translocase subunit SecY [Candidatus Ishikawaella capsulata]BAH83131.1 protein translocase subunit SecY [Candidatus Ishikawaella capsulata Mpkobe]